MLTHPAPGFTQGNRYGPRPVFNAGGIKTSAFHGGQDWYPAKGASRTVVAAADGVVVASPYNASAGNALAIWHPHLGKWTGYAHLATRLVSVGTSVRAGQAIGVAGSTGASTGVHLHFDVFTSLTAFTRIDPLPLIGTPKNAAQAATKKALMFLMQVPAPDGRVWLVKPGSAHHIPNTKALASVRKGLAHAGWSTDILQVNHQEAMDILTAVRSNNA